MRKTFTLFALLLLTMQAALAQQPFGHLTLFSEDGDKFYLVLNGEKINEIAQTNLRVEELVQPYYNAKVIFEDGTKSEISKNYLQIADMDGIFSDVTYKIKRDKNNPTKMKMNFFSMTPVVQGYIPPKNVYVTRYGHPAPSGTVVQTTTTTTAVGGINAGINVNGVGVNVSVSNPGFGSTVTETTTVSSSTSTTGGIIEDDSPCPYGRAMNQQNFASALQTIKNQNFEDTKLSTANQISQSNCLNAAQIGEICKTFGFEETKLTFAKSAYATCVDQNNYFKVNNVFTFSSSADELNSYISGR
ncbi:MAG TPA: DUF4476 domain-containing protein [Flavobacterium sp.]|jgi:hypothetical protein